MKLTEKQKRFCEEYLIDLNATQAAIRAGYSERTADRIANQNLRKLEIQKYLSELQKGQSERTQITADKVLAELAAIAFSDRTELASVAENGIVHITPTSELAENARKAIAGIKEGRNGVEVTSYDKLKALELIGKHLGMFVDKQQNLPPAAEQEVPGLYAALGALDDDSGVTGDDV